MPGPMIRAEQWGSWSISLAAGSAVTVSNFPSSFSINNLPATQFVSGSVSVSNFPASQSVTGSVAVSNFPTTQPVSGSVSVSNFPTSQAVTGTFWQATQPVSGSVSVNNFPSAQAVTGTFWQAVQPISGAVSVSNFPATQAIAGSVAVSNFPATQSVTGTFWQALQPIAKRGGSTILSGQVLVGTSAVRVVPARAARQDVVIAPASRVAYYVGAAGVTSATGMPVLDGGAITLETTAEVWVVAAANVQIGFVETFG